MKHSLRVRTYWSSGHVVRRSWKTASVGWTNVSNILIRDSSNLAFLTGFTTLLRSATLDKYWECKSLWFFSRWLFKPCTVCLPGIVLPKEYNLVHSLHCALLESDSTLVKKFQIGFTDILAFKLFPSYLVYVSNRLTDFSQRKSTRY